MATLFLLLAGCGGSDVSERAKLESEVSGAMSNLPYSFDVLKKYSTDQYVVFRVRGSTSVDIAYGGKSKGGKCSKAPRLPVKHRHGSKPFAAAGPEPLICFEHDGWRPGSSEAAAVARLRAVNLMANALCEEVYEGYEGFACFD